MRQNVPSKEDEKEIANLKLEKEDINMINNIRYLDTQDASSVKRYVNNIRNKSYKQELSDIDHEEEEQ